MSTKEHFNRINEQFLNGVNLHYLNLNDDEQKIVNYINGIRAFIKQNGGVNEKLVLSELQLIYSTLKIDLFNKETTLKYIKKCGRNKLLVECILFANQKIKHKKLIQKTEFWELFIHSIVFYQKDNFSSFKPKLLVFIKVCNLFFGAYDYRDFKDLFIFILNHDLDALKSIVGNDCLPYKVSDSKFKEMGRLFEILSILKSANAESDVLQHLFILFANYEKASIIYEPEFLELIHFLLSKFPTKPTLTTDRTRFTKLYFLFKLNPHLFEKIEVKNVLIDSYFTRYSNLRQPKFITDRIIIEVLKKFNVSYFFINNFMNHTTNLSDKELKWLGDVVQGKNLVYSENLPCKLSKKIIHKFNTVIPDWEWEANIEEYTFYSDWEVSIKNLSVTEGLIWSAIMYEVKNLPYTSQALECIAHKENTHFWVKVMIQLFRNRFRENDITHEIVDYIDYQIFTLGRDINFKNKKKNNLINEVNQWHFEVSSMKFNQNERLVKLPISTIKTFNIEHNEINYVIKQLRTNRELAHEGYQLNHCVVTYTANCLTGKTFIFSLRELNRENKEKPLITIEVFDKRIFQKRGNYNRSCLSYENEIIEIWAKENHLRNF